MATSETPIFDQLVIDRAVSDPEGVALVEAIHERQRLQQVEPATELLPVLEGTILEIEP